MGLQEAVTNIREGISGDNDYHCCSKKSCLLNGLNESQIKEISPRIHHRKILHRGDVLIAQGDPFGFLYQVRSGSFKSYIIDNSGDWQITGFQFSTDILGLDGIRSGQHVYQVEALETSSVCSLPFRAVEKILDQDRGGFYRRLISAMSTDEYSQHKSLMVVGRLRAEQKLANFLLEMSSRMNVRGTSETEFHLSMARYDIANYLGLAVETLSRLFKRLQEEGLISVSRNYVRILDAEGLRFMLYGDNQYSELQRIA